MVHPTDRITHTTAFVTPVVEHWLEDKTDQVLADGRADLWFSGLSARLTIACFPRGTFS